MTESLHTEHFNQMELPQPLFHRLEQHGLTQPTPIQAQAIPLALEGRDILGSAQTGSGKTAAFGIPLVTHLLNDTIEQGLILLPTRELATQVMKALEQFIGRSKISTALLIGGADMGKQCRKLEQKPRLIIGTPGRINDHLKRGTLSLQHTHFLVLDEVDRMLDMGFGIQLEAIAKHLTSERQTLMFSATLPKGIEKLAANYLCNPVRIAVDPIHAPATKIKQTHLILQSDEKYPRLLEELDERSGSIVIFIKTKHAADNMARKLRKKGHQVEALHGDMRQSKRNRVITIFREQKCRILVATDVAARGLDIPHIEHVINYDLPQCPEDYIHRIGRTARAGAEGEAINFISPADKGKWVAIEHLMDPDAKAPKNTQKSQRPKKSKSSRRFRFKKKQPQNQSKTSTPRLRNKKNKQRKAKKSA